LSEVFPFAVSKYLKHRYLIKDVVDEASHDLVSYPRYEHRMFR
jgi:hypothetical protein